MAKCPSGVICFENFTFTFIIFSLILIIYFMYNKQNYKSIEIVQTNEKIPNTYSNGLFPRPSFYFSNIPNDVLLNP